MCEVQATRCGMVGHRKLRDHLLAKGGWKMKDFTMNFAETGQRLLGDADALGSEGLSL